MNFFFTYEVEFVWKVWLPRLVKILGEGRKTHFTTGSHRRRLRPAVVSNIRIDAFNKTHSPLPLSPLKFFVI